MSLGLDNIIVGHWMKGIDFDRMHFGREHSPSQVPEKVLASAWERLVR